MRCGFSASNALGTEFWFDRSPKSLLALIHPAAFGLIESSDDKLPFSPAAAK